MFTGLQSSPSLGET